MIKKGEQNLYNIKVMNNKETIDYILKNHCSISRFGDGELGIIEGETASFQNNNKELRKKLKEIIETESNKQLLVCLNNIFNGLDEFTPTARAYWEKHLNLSQNKRFFIKLGKLNHLYGNATVTRPYIDYLDNKEAKYIFDSFKKIWKNQDILIVEGCFTRSGIDNDLFAGAKSIQRIICPAENAWSKHKKIESLIRKYGKNKIVLVMLGMTATVIAAELSSFTQILDIGHLDAEYDWFRMQAKSKVKLKGKHTPESHDFKIPNISDKQYKNEIVADISKAYRVKNYFMGYVYKVYKFFKHESN